MTAAVDVKSVGAILRARYDQYLTAYGDSARGANWPNDHDRRTRFDVMLEVMRSASGRQLVLCDLGCGTGELLGRIRERGIRDLAYVGVDASARALAFARAKFPDATFVELDVNEPGADLKQIDCDYLVASGLFTAKYELTQDEMWSFLAATVNRVWPHVRRGIAFNVMSKIVDWERDDLFHASMDDVARLLHGLAGRNVRFRADYGLYEYTAYAFRRAGPQPVAGSAPPDGGRDGIPVLRPRLPTLDRLAPYLKQIDDARIYTNGGPLVQALEERLCRLFGLPRGSVASASSGTAALVGAILASAGRAPPARPYALIPAYTFVATASAAEQCGYQPWLADVDAATWTLNPVRIAERTDLDRIGVVIPVAAYGRPVPVAPWLEFRRRTGIPVVIDGAASLEGIVGSPEEFLGEVPVALSFHATKSLSTGEGGCVVTSELALTARSASALNYGFRGSRNSAMPSINGKLSEYHAAIGLAELDAWPESSAALRSVAEAYRQRFIQKGLGDCLHAAPETAACYVLFQSRSVEETLACQRALEEGGVDYRLWYGGGIHCHRHFQDCLRDSLPVTDFIAPLLLGLPIAADMTSAAVGRVMDAVSSAAGATR